MYFHRPTDPKIPDPADRDPNPFCGAFVWASDVDGRHFEGEVVAVSGGLAWLSTYEGDRLADEDDYLVVARLSDVHEIEDDVP